MKILKNLTATMTAISTILGGIVLIFLLLGYRPYVLKTQSMEPEYRQGSLCWINTKVDLDQLAVGDPIVYRSPANSLVFHRLIRIDAASDSSLSVAMKGDANELTQVIELSHVNYTGREAITIPQVGAIADFLLSHHILWILITAFIFLSCIPWDGLHEEREVAAL